MSTANRNHIVLETVNGPQQSSARCPHVCRRRPVVRAGVGDGRQIDDVAVQDLLISVEAEEQLKVPARKRRCFKPVCIRLTARTPPRVLSACIQRCIGLTGRSHPATGTDTKKEQRVGRPVADMLILNFENSKVSERNKLMVQQLTA